MKEEPDYSRDKYPREVALDAAKKLVTGDRNDAYGPPSRNFGDLADMLNIWFRGRSLDYICPTDVAAINCFIKLARLKNSPAHADSWIDLAGYASLGYEVSQQAADSGGKMKG